MGSGDLQIGGTQVRVAVAHVYLEIVLVHINVPLGRGRIRAQDILAQGIQFRILTHFLVAIALRVLVLGIGIRLITRLGLALGLEL